MKKLILLLLFTLFVLSCSDDGENEKILTSIEIIEKNPQIKVGEKFQFTVKHNPTEIEKPAYKWESTDKYIAKVDTSGYVEAIKDGEVTIKVSTKTYPYFKDEVTFEVAPVIAESMSLDSVVSVFYGDSKCLRIKYYPENSKELEIEWTSSDESVATVSQYGCLRINGTGNTVITGKAKGKNLSVSCKVSINHRNPTGASVQCIAKTQSGSRCKRMTTNKNAKCWQHQ